MATKHYLRLATYTGPGTLPASNASVSATTPSQIGDSGTNHTTTTVVGASQQSIAITTAANTSAQQSLIGRWIVGPIAAQTVGSQNITLHIGGSESLAASNFQIRFVAAIWRPSTGAIV